MWRGGDSPQPLDTDCPSQARELFLWTVELVRVGSGSQAEGQGHRAEVVSGCGRRETAVNMWGSSVGEHLVAQANE